MRSIGSFSIQLWAAFSGICLKLMMFGSSRILSDPRDDSAYPVLLWAAASDVGSGIWIKLMMFGGSRIMSDPGDDSTHSVSL